MSGHSDLVPVNLSPDSPPPIEEHVCSERRNSVDSVASVQGSYWSEEEYRFVEVSHPAQVLSGLNHLRDSGRFCDVTLCVNSQEFPCHKIVLSSFSPYFNAMFTGNLAESAQDKVTLNDVEASVIKLLIDYAYTSEVVINRQNVQSLLSAANLLEILPVKEACGQYLEQNMDESNCIGIHCFAETHACTELQQQSKEFILNNFTSVSQNEEFLHVSAAKLIEFFSDDELCVDSEEQVFELSVKWLEHDKENRNKDFAQIMGHIRLSLVSPYFLFDVVEKQGVVNQSQKCKELVDEAKTYLLLQDRHPELQNKRTKLRKSLGLNAIFQQKIGYTWQPVLMVEEEPAKLRKEPLTYEKYWQAFSHTHIGRIRDLNPCRQRLALSQNTTFELKKIERIKPDKNVEDLIEVFECIGADFEEQSSGHMEVIICVGGEDDKVVLRSVEMFNPETCRWKPLSCLPFAISKHGLVSSGDCYIYLAGGEFPDGSASRSVYRFDQNLDLWQEMGPLNVARSELVECKTADFEIPVSDLKSLAVNTLTLNCSGCNSPNPSGLLFFSLDYSFHLVRLLACQGLACLAMLDGHMYAVGGWDGKRRLDSVERYDPETNSWSFIPPMKMALTSPAVASLRGYLYVTGGAVLEDGDGMDLVQCYNPRTDTWIEKPSMLIARSGSAACIVNGNIFVIGGWHASTENTNKVECYNPITNQWVQKAPMNERRYRPGVAVVGNRIYVCGGEEGWDRYHDTIECYNPDTDSWEIVGEMLTSRSWLSCVSMRVRKNILNMECRKCTCNV